MTDAMHSYASPGGYSAEYDDQDVEDYGNHHGHSQPPDAVKLFVGQVPRNMEEAALRPILEAFGPLYDIVIIRDKVSGTHRGCAFVTFCSRDAADAAIETLHNQVTLPMSSNPLQVRPAEGQAGASQEHKLFIGMIPKHADESSIREVFASHGPIEEIYILRHPATGQSKGCAFLKYKDRHAASAAIDAYNGTYTMERGTAPLVVKFADSRRQRIQRARNQAATAAAAYWQLPPNGTIPFPQLQQIQQQYMQQMQAFGPKPSPVSRRRVRRRRRQPTPRRSCTTTRMRLLRRVRTHRFPPAPRRRSRWTRWPAPCRRSQQSQRRRRAPAPRRSWKARPAPTSSSTTCRMT
ncbi:hypothetical protein SPRG_02658 [Saprolegnia parasitica CBS 223.65]|uniref:RRM domain-containing protein n=1 Tax=Saprolegnia parasitica (strain CBS 223.65) TaxID=695850 RepID=A0A067D2H2_SAPPC|nr:hypothetical protein SPRG_02658 [Saprolegnia parasitica CBS 223.65]KDO32966.1 hypothetical protein SPRG_02658 [Saprolegnia parasitica CBS 223.65]|eukprot:XP_012196612.1 hypothetical protein SPRG_02658 [Saprolegnia parasitica CBS 223.65]